MGTSEMVMQRKGETCTLEMARTRLGLVAALELCNELDPPMAVGSEP